jgi:hypothetical protein
MLLEWNLTLGEDVVVQSWRSDDAVKQIVEKGHKTLVGNYMYWVSYNTDSLSNDYSTCTTNGWTSTSIAAKANGSTKTPTTRVNTRTVRIPLISPPVRLI